MDTKFTNIFLFKIKLSKYLIFAFFRELISTGSIGDRIFGIPLTFSAFKLPFGGFILLGLFAALFRKIKISIGRNK